MSCSHLLRTALLAALTLGSAISFAATEPTPLSIPRDKIQKEGLQLPEFAIYRADGQRIWERKGYSPKFVTKMEESLSKNQPDGGSLDADLRSLFPDLPPLPASVEFVLVEYWATWCAPCHMQRDDIAAWLKTQPEGRFVWYYVEKDPMKGTEHKPVKLNPSTPEQKALMERFRAGTMTPEDKKKFGEMMEAAGAEIKVIKTPENSTPEREINK